MKQYLKALEQIIEKGYKTGDRTGVGTTALPGYSYQCELSMDDHGVIHNYPLITKKRFS
jgi:thymidylate synthase